MRIQTNLPALNAHRQMGRNTSRVEQDLEKLASGLKINRAADDASGLGISEKMRALITGLSQASANAGEGIALIQTADGALQETHDMLQRMGELTVKAMNGVMGDQERAAMDSEYQNLVTEIDRIAQSTKFNGTALLNGSLARPDKTAVTSGMPYVVIPTVQDMVVDSSEGTAVASTTSSRAAPDVTLTPPTGVATTIPMGGDFNITADGVYEIADGFTGKINVAAGLKVLLKQATPSTALENVTIDCAAGVELHIEDLNIENNTDINAIKFTGAGNKLNTIGDNKIKSTIVPASKLAPISKKALIHVGGGTDVEFTGTGSLYVKNADEKIFSSPGENSVTWSPTAAAIGGDSGEGFGVITINSGTISVDNYGSGAGIGGGDHGKDDARESAIVINGGNIQVDNTSGGAAIGTGELHQATNSRILITGGTIYAKNDEGCGGAAIGSGASGFIKDIYISGGTIFADTSLSEGAAIGSGYWGLAYNWDTKQRMKITIENAIINIEHSIGAGIGGGDSGGLPHHVAPEKQDRMGDVGGHGTITIKSGTITINPTTRTQTFGAGIGSGADSDTVNSSITIEGGTILINKMLTSQGAGIGGGEHSDGGKITIAGGNITIFEQVINVPSLGILLPFGASIGGGSGCVLRGGEPGKGADLNITGGTIKIENGYIGGGRDVDSDDVGEDGTTYMSGGTLAFVPPANFGTNYHNGLPNGTPIIDRSQITETTPPVDPPDPPVDPPDPPVDPPDPPVDPPNPPVDPPDPPVDPPDPPVDPPDPPVGPPAQSGGLILQIGAEYKSYNRLTVYIEDMTASGLSLTDSNVLTMDGASHAYGQVKAAINHVSQCRGQLGAYQNRLEYTVNNLDSTAENTTAARSRIVDTDMAKQMMEYTKGNVLNQAAQAMLAQANQTPNQILQLLQ